MVGKCTVCGFTWNTAAQSTEPVYWSITPPGAPDNHSAESQ